MKHLKALLIDPWQKKIHELADVPADIRAWHELLHCDCLDRAEVSRNPQETRAIDIWVDDEGFMRDQPAPTFRVRGYANPLCGYGLVLGANLVNGESIDAPLGKERMEQLILWEKWERRLDPANYFAELTRVPSWEHV